MEVDIADSTDGESSPKDADTSLLKNSNTETDPIICSRNKSESEKRKSVDFDNILDSLEVKDEFDMLPNVAGEVSDELLPKDSFVSSFASNKLSDNLINRDDSLESIILKKSPSPISQAEKKEESANKVNTRASLKKVTLEEMLIDAGQPIFQPITMDSKGKKEVKTKRKSVALPSNADSARGDQNLPSIVGFKPAGKKSSSSIHREDQSRMRREDKNAEDKLPPLRNSPVKKKVNPRHSKTNISKEAEDALSIDNRDSVVHLPNLPHTSPAETKKERRRKNNKPLYVRMMERAQMIMVEEEKAKHEEYLRQKNLRAKGHFNRAEIKEHIRQHDELLRQKQSESKASHVSQMRALKKRAKEVDSHEDSILGENDSISTIDNHKPMKSKHRKQLEDYDAIALKVEDDARERKTKYKKLQDMITPKKNQHKSKSSDVDDEEEEAKDSDDDAMFEEKESRAVDRSEALCIASTFASLDKSTILECEALQRPQSAFSDDLDAINNISEDTKGSSSNYKKSEQNTISAPSILDKVYINPFQNMQEDIKISVDSTAIPTLIDSDWLTMLSTDQEITII